MLIGRKYFEFLVQTNPTTQATLGIQIIELFSVYTSQRPFALRFINHHLHSMTPKKTKLLIGATKL